MEKPYIVDQKFEKESTLAIGEYEHCVFKNCQFESEDFKNFQFVDCTFESCNLSLVKLSGASLQKVHFKDCKMQGLRFEACNPFLFEVSFDTCVLNLSSFYQIKGKKRSSLVVLCTKWISPKLISQRLPSMIAIWLAPFLTSPM